MIFIKNFARWKGTKSDKLDKVMKKDFIENTLEEEGTQTFASGVNGDKCTWKSEVISLSRSSISKSIRLRWKIRSQDKEVSLPKMTEMDRFLVVVTLKSFGNCEHKG